MNDAFIKNYLALALEPIHVGARRSQCGDDGMPRSFTSGTARNIDGFPVVPASSLKGCVRALCSTDFGVSSCDGKGWNCPQPHICPSCSIFGFSNYHHGASSSSLVRFSEANIIAIPVRTVGGVVWLTSWFRLSHIGLTAESRKNIGTWAIAEALNDKHVSALAMLFQKDLGYGGSDPIRIKTDHWPGPQHVREAFTHLVVVDENTLSALVAYSTDSVSSISIDPLSGHAKPSALFEIEFINRWSILHFDVTYVNPAMRGIREFLNTKNPELPAIPATIHGVSQIVESALDKIRFFGIGGKRSRGYGRLLVWPISNSEHDSSQYGSERLTPPKAPVRVMISYSQANKSVARRLAADLQEAMFDVWLDEREVLVGDLIHARVEEGLSECDYLIALLSPASLKSAWVREEICAIQAREIESRCVVLLPAVLEGVDTTSLPALLKNRRFALLIPYDEGLQDLIKSIHGHEARRIIMPYSEC